MPRLPTDCSKYVMYKLCCLDHNIPDEYVGSTTNFTERKTQHKSRCNNPNSKEYNHKVYQFIRLNGGWNNWTMVQIEPYNCNSKREAEAREEYWRKELKATLNGKRIFITAEERLEYNKEYNKECYEYYKEYKKKYREQNKEYLDNKQREKRRLKKEQS
jgi:hypothetical protein